MTNGSEICAGASVEILDVRQLLQFLPPGQWHAGGRRANSLTVPFIVPLIGVGVAQEAS